MEQSYEPSYTNKKTASVHQNHVGYTELQVSAKRLTCFLLWVFIVSSQKSAW